MSLSFKDAFEKLQHIQQRLQSDELIDVEELVTLHEEAKTCYDTCSRLLMKVQEKIEF